MLVVNERNMVSGLEIHRVIESKNKRFDIWVKRAIDYADLTEGKDFCTKLYESTGGRPFTDYEFSLDAAKEICLLERSDKGKQVRKWLIDLSNKHDKGLAFTAEQVTALIDLSKSMILVSIQKEVQNKHFKLYNETKSWHQYRANLLGYSTQSLTEAMKAVNKKYKSQRDSLVKLDGNELIRTGVIDFMIALGKTEEYAVNVGDLCKRMSEKMELTDVIWDDTKPNPLGLKTREVKKARALFEKSKLIN